MGNWSISPTDFVDFNSDTGKATFRDGSDGNTYIVKYTSESCSASAMFTVGSEPTPPTPPGPTPPGPTPTDCDEYIKAFETAVGHTFSPNETTYNYLCKLYAEAEQQFDGGTEEGLPVLYKEENFPNVYNYYGDKGTEENAFATLVGWLFALQLAELKPKNRVAIFKTGYELGGYTRESDVFGYKFKSDPNVARLVASGIYVAMRGNMSPNISTMRTEVGGSKYSDTIDYYRNLSLESESAIQNYVINENGFFTDLREFMPSAPGPYAPGYTSRPSYIIPDEKEEFSNTKVDRAIHEYIVQNYNLNSTDITKKKMAVQAIADKETCNNHLFGDNKTVEDGSETYTFHPVFGVDTIGVRLNTTGNLPNLINAMIDTGSDYRKILLSPYVNPKQYGRLRPGCSWTQELKKNSDIDDRRNELCNKEIEDKDGCSIPNSYKTYDSNGNFVGYTFVQGHTKSDYCEAQKASLPANSYPSGHSSGMWCGALTLIELMPNKADLIMKSANQYAVNRTIARWHWTSDTINGRVLGSAGNSIAHAASDYDDRLNQAKGDVPN